MTHYPSAQLISKPTWWRSVPLLLAASVLVTSSQYVGASPILVYPERAESFTQSLNGEWSFKYLPSLDVGADAKFNEPDFKISDWKTIRVPGHWELQGFAEPRYALKLENGLGLYRRNFKVPAGWSKDRRVCLRLEGVAFGYEAWVNGKSIGMSSASAYNPHTFDITDAMKDGENVLAIQVTTKPLGYEFDVNDDWALSGIYRDVTLFSIPDTNIQDFTTRTKVKADGSAQLTVAVKVNQPEATVHGKLTSPDGKLISEFDLPHNGELNEAIIPVSQAQLWTAETPSLYQLHLTLSAKGKELQTIRENIGLREVSIVDGILKVNGRPIKLHGVNHHDIEPDVGRSVTEAQMRRDLELMKKGNVNFIRTSHYSPQPRLLELCDEMGFYVMDEVSIGKGEEHLNDPKYLPNILARVEPTITRDKNRASVIIWSIGNENPVTDAENQAGRLAKKLDPTRPICMPKIGSYFAKNYEKIPDYIDIYAPHYPSNSTLKGFAKTLKRPLILTEYAHALGLATDRIQDQWEILQNTPGFAGGSIWHFHDQGILRTSAEPVDRSKPTDYVWTDATHYYDTFGGDGCDGIVYSDRTPQTDFWEMRKVYSPVQIEENTAAVKAGTQEIPLTIQNRHDFRSLKGMKLAWSLLRNGTEIQKGGIPLTAASREKETVKVSVDIPKDAGADILSLEVRCLDEKELQLTERSVRLNLSDASTSDWLKLVSAGKKPEITEKSGSYSITGYGWTLKVDRNSGALTINDKSGKEIVSGIHPHPGRTLTMAEGRSAGKNNTWRYTTLTKIIDAKVEAAEKDGTITLSISGTYPRPAAETEKEVRRSDEPLDQQEKGDGKPKDVQEESLTGGYTAEISPNGSITIRYDYAPTQVEGSFSEAGLSISLPTGFGEFRWIGQGPYSGYPGKDRLNEFGIHHLNREDLRYQGNRRGTEIALATNASGAGVALLTSPADVAIERDGDKTLLSHNAVISGLGNKGSNPETVVRVQKTPHVSGSFTLVLLSSDWPEAIQKYFGKPGTASQVFRPFYHSYDQ